MTVRDASDPKQADRARAQEKRDNATRETILRVLMSSAEGRRYVWLELEYYKVFHQSNTISDHAALAFFEGRRSAGLRLIQDVTRLCPQQYIEMTLEANNRDKKEDFDARSSPDDGSPSELGSSED